MMETIKAIKKLPDARHYHFLFSSVLSAMFDIVGYWHFL
jgi:hypothetical protein